MAQLAVCFTGHCPDLSAILQLFKENGMKMCGRKEITFFLFIRSDLILHENISVGFPGDSVGSTVKDNS